MTKQKWAVTASAVVIVLTLVGVGFAAMSTSPPFTVPSWLPPVFFVLAGCVALALIAYLTWGLLIRLRLQAPIVIINQNGRTNTVSNTLTTRKQSPTRLMHDGVLWEEAQSWNSYYAKGPLCPQDYTPLAIKLGNRMDTEIKDNSLIQRDGYTQLVCPECNGIYTLGASDKRIRDSRSEATSRFEGMRRRENYQ